MSITVGPIETYVTDSDLSNPTNYAEVSTQEQVSVNLTSSTLWLVDSSTLNTQTVSTSPIVEQPLEPSVQDSVLFANIDTTAPGISLPAAINDGTSVTSIQDTNPLLLAEVLPQGLPPHRPTQISSHRIPQRQHSRPQTSPLLPHYRVFQPQVHPGLKHPARPPNRMVLPLPF